MRTGHLIQPKVYLVHKMINNIPGNEMAYEAPAGSKITWDIPEDRVKDFRERYGVEYTGTNAGHEDSYGGRLLHWIDVWREDGQLYGGIGAEEGVDFVFDD